MRTTPLLILLLSCICAIIASPQLIGRQEQQGFWPDWGTIGDGLTLLRGFGNFFLDPQDSDTSNTKPAPNTDDTSDKQISPDSPQVSPASPSIPAPTDPVYNLVISNDQPPLPDLEPSLGAVLPPVNPDQECGTTNVSPQIGRFSKNERTLPIHDHFVNSD